MYTWVNIHSPYIYVSLDSNIEYYYNVSVFVDFPIIWWLGHLLERKTNKYIDLGLFEPTIICYVVRVCMCATGYMFVYEYFDWICWILVLGYDPRVLACSVAILGISLFFIVAYDLLKIYTQKSTSSTVFFLINFLQLQKETVTEMLVSILVVIIKKGD